MKNFQIRSLTGLIFTLFFVLNISLVIIAVLKNDDLYIAYAILLSCAQFYLYEKFKSTRILNGSDTDESNCNTPYNNVDATGIQRYNINLN